MVDEAAIAEDVAVKKAVDLVKEKAVVTEKAYEEPKTEETKAEDAEAPKLNNNLTA